MPHSRSRSSFSRSFRSPKPAIRRRLAFAWTLALAAVLLVTGACSDGGSSGPTDPGPTTGPVGSAVVQGTVDDGAGGLAVPAPPTPRRPADAGPGGSTPTAAPAPAPAAVTGVQVSIQGTGLATTTDGAGRFRLDGVPSGNQVVVFASGNGSDGVVVDDVQPAETIDLAVRFAGGSAEVESLQRDGGDPEAGEGGEAPVLELQVAPREWDLGFDNASGTVTTFLRGEGFERVDVGSVELSGDDPAAAPLAHISSTREGDHVRSRFPMNRVLELLADPRPGSTHTVIVTFTIDDGDETLEVRETIVVVDEDDDEGENDGEDDEGEDDEGEDEEGDDETLGDLSLQISPSTWNTNFDRANGNVTVFVRGDGLSAIDLDSIELSGDADSLAPSFARLEGNHVRAQFPQSRVLEILEEPESGTTHTVTVSFSGDGEDFELEAEVRIVGP